jgi:carboxylesterase type B
VKSKAAAVPYFPLHTRILRVAALLLTLAVGAPLAGRAQYPTCAAGVPTIALNQPAGQLCGIQDTAQAAHGTVTASAYLGIPYAQAPARWTNPQALTTAPWTGTFPATQYGNICPQPVPSGALPPSCPGTSCPNPLPNCDLPPPNQSEDCLYLNVWVPTGTAPTASLPVMVYIHGGAFLEGSGSSPLFDGTYLAAQHNKIVVSFNYRLGVLGFLAMDGITTSANNNFGFRDQIQALQWIKSNIPSFGGDAGNVTIFGESAGAMSVGLHALSSSTSQPLFQRAMMESNPLGVPYKDLTTATTVGNYFAAKIVNGAAGCDVACMQAKTAQDLVQAELSPSLSKWAISPKAKPYYGAGLGLEALLLWSPSLDGTLLNGQPLNAGAQLHDSLLLGTNQNEGTLFAYLMASGYTPFNKTHYSELLVVLFGFLNGVTKHSRYACTGTDCTPALANVLTDYLFTCSNRHLADAAPDDGGDVYMYYFNQVPSFACTWPAACICVGQVCHGDDLPFVFHTPQGVCPSYQFSSAEEKLSASMAGDWASFASGTAPWQAFGSTKLYETLNSTGGNAPDPLAATANCDFWEKHYKPANQKKMLQRMAKAIQSKKETK